MVKVSKKDESTFVVKRKKGLGRIEGISKPRLMYEGSNEDGSEKITDGGEYLGQKFPSAKEMIVPKFDSIEKKWGFAGDEVVLKKLVKSLELVYGKKHHRAGQTIVKANLRDPQDPFFDNATWFDRPLIMEGSSHVISDKSPREHFLRLCLLGSRFTQNSDEEGNPLTAAGMQFEIIKSTADDTVTIAKANVKLELFGELNAMSIEKAAQISVIIGLLYDDINVNADIVKPNLLEAIEKTSPNPGEVRIFEGKSYQKFFMEIYKDKPDMLTKKVNIKKGLNKNVLRFKEGSYNLKGKPLVGVSNFTALVGHFADKENTEDYTTLIEALEA